MISLICRLYDVTAGSVRVDGIDVREFDLEQLWTAIGVVPQRGYLFSGTVADNLQVGAPRELWRPKATCGTRSRWRLPTTSYAPTPTGWRCASRRGINFSGGQRQRLAIARAVIRRPAVYLFDDAFSALDVRTDAQVRAALREESAGSTVVIVSQRISTIAQADQIIVIDNGRILGVGSHDTLLTDCPEYAEFADSQVVGAP